MWENLAENKLCCRLCECMSGLPTWLLLTWRDLGTQVRGQAGLPLRAAAERQEELLHLGTWAVRIQTMSKAALPLK